MRIMKTKEDVQVSSFVLNALCHSVSHRPTHFSAKDYVNCLQLLRNKQPQLVESYEVVSVNFVLQYRLLASDALFLDE